MTDLKKEIEKINMVFGVNPIEEIKQKLVELGFEPKEDFLAKQNLDRFSTHLLQSGKNTDSCLRVDITNSTDNLFSVEVKELSKKDYDQTVEKIKAYSSFFESKASGEIDEYVEVMIKMSKNNYNVNFLKINFMENLVNKNIEEIQGFALDARFKYAAQVVTLEDSGFNERLGKALESKKIKTKKFKM